MAVIDNLKYMLEIDSNDKSFKKAEQNLKSLGDTMKKLAIAGTAIFGFTKLLTDQIAKTDRLAQSVGTTTDITEAFGFEMKKIGLDQNNFIDLMEEMNNKMGEMKGLGEFTAVEESMQILGLEFEKIKALSPEKQFEAIATASLNMADSQKAVTAVDMLMGGEANKLLGSLRAQGLTYQDVIRKQQMYNFQTDKTRRGAMQFADASADLMLIITSFSKTLAGVLGEAMAQTLNQFMEWVTVNKELIKSGIDKFAKVLVGVFNTLWTVVRSLFNMLNWVTEAMGGFEKVSNFIISGAMVFGLYKVIQAVQLLGFAFLGLGKIIRKIPIIGALALLADDIRGWIAGEQSIMAQLVGDYDTWLPQFMEGLDVIRMLSATAFDKTVSTLSEVSTAITDMWLESWIVTVNSIIKMFTFVGSMMVSTLQVPINFLIDSLNVILGSLSAIGKSAVFKNLGVDFNIDEIQNVNLLKDAEPMKQFTVEGVKENMAQGANNIVNMATDIVVNVADATSEQAQQMVQTAIIGSMEHERLKLQTQAK